VKKGKVLEATIDKKPRLTPVDNTISGYKPLVNEAENTSINRCRERGEGAGKRAKRGSLKRNNQGVNIRGVEITAMV